MAELHLAVEYNEIPHTLKCTKCNNVLKDACLLGCGCRFCRACIDEMVASGHQFCSGSREACSEMALSTASQDEVTNTTISRLQVICPQTECRQHYSLVKHDEHLKLCSNGSVNCPFRELGCNQTLTADHLLSTNCVYANVLIGQHRKISEMRLIIDEQNRQIDMLGYALERRDGELMALSTQSTRVDTLYRSMLDEMRLLRTTNEALTAKMTQLTSRLDREITTRSENDDKNFARNIDYIDRKVTTINRLIGIEEDEFEIQQTIVDEDFKSRKNDIPSLNRENKSIREDIHYLKSKLKCTEAATQIDASWVWIIEEDVRDPNWDWKDKPIQHFYGALCPYKFRLASWNYDTQCDSLAIHLRIYHGTKDEDLPWPFRGTVSITVADKTKPESCLIVTKKCEIKRPLNDRYSFSEDFVFAHVPLISIGVNLSSGLRVLCAIITDTSRRYGLYSWLWGR